ncbi:rhombosortase [Alteromonas lipotrueiana]|uniref:rhombosortase n=1 Tax=Alteromonas lipotrueiana TaxID=2803815 RepID=UPI001C479D21|nr:rhombosortase [Alteromonas lipotrueiana]
MITLPISPKHSVGPLIIALTAIIVFFLEPAASDWLAYDRYALQGWETWRVLTGNLVHTNGYHLLLNLGGLGLLWLLHAEHYRILRFLKVFGWCCLGTSVAIYIGSPDLIWYVGLSGALHGVFVWGACMDIASGVRSGWLLLTGVAAKVVYEQLGGSSSSVAELIQAKVATDAHLYGAVCGLVLFFAMYGLRKPAK